MQLELADTHTPSPATSTVYFAPPHMGDGDPLAGPNLDPILVPFARHLVIRHFTLEHSLIRGLYRQICNVLQDLQLFLWTRREGDGAVTAPGGPKIFVSTLPRTIPGPGDTAMNTETIAGLVELMF